MLKRFFSVLLLLAVFLNLLPLCVAAETKAASVKADQVVFYGNTDIILILDHSNSMYQPYSVNADYIKDAVKAFAEIAFVNDNEYNNRIAMVQYDAEARAWSGSELVQFKWGWDSSLGVPCLERNVASYGLTYNNCFMSTQGQVETALNACMYEPDPAYTSGGLTNTMGGLFMADVVARTRAETTERPLLIVMFTDGLPTARYLTQTRYVTYDNDGVRTSAWEYRRTVEEAQNLRRTIDSYPNSEASIYNIALFNAPDMDRRDFKIADGWMSDETNYQWTYDTNYNSDKYTNLKSYVDSMSKYFTQIEPVADYYNRIVGSITREYLPQLYRELAYRARIVKPIEPECEHTETDSQIVEATCTQAGVEREFCTICGEILHEEAIAIKPHTYDDGVITTAPTCTAEGVKTFTCTFCEDSYTEAVNMLAHNYTHMIVEPTCTAAGFTSYLCVDCLNSYTDNEMAALGHNYEASVTKQTCTENGYTTYTCSVCRDSYTGDEIVASGHSYEAIVTEPTCIENGYTTYTCSVCWDSYTGDEVVANGHSYDEGKITKEPTCTEAGEKTFTCTCGDVKAESIATLSHNPVYCPEKAATCTESGYGDHYRCDSCKNTFFDAECSFPAPSEYLQIPATGHSYTDGKCACGATEVIEPELKPNEALDVITSISVGAEMQVVYTIPASEVKGFDSFYLEVVKEVANGESVTTVFSLDNGNMIAVTNAAGNISRYVATYTGIFAMEMGDNFTATVYSVEADGTIHYGQPDTSSIKSFLMQQLADENALAEIKTLAVDMLNYGAAAQVQFDYDVENLVNADLTDEQKALGTQMIPSAVDASAASGNGGRVITSVSVQSKVKLYLTFIYKVADDSNLKVVIKDAKGKILSECAPDQINTANCKASYDNVGARQMREPITIELYDNDTLVSQSVTWNVESYVAQTRADTNSSEALINAVNAMLAYGDSTALYLEATGQ